MKGFVYRLSYDCHLDIDRDVSNAYYKSSSGDRVNQLVVGDWCFRNLAHG